MYMIVRGMQCAFSLAMCLLRRQTSVIKQKYLIYRPILHLAPQFALFKTVEQENVSHKKAKVKIVSFN